MQNRVYSIADAGLFNEVYSTTMDMDYRKKFTECGYGLTCLYIHLLFSIVHNVCHLFWTACFNNHFFVHSGIKRICVSQCQNCIYYDQWILCRAWLTASEQHWLRVRGICWYMYKKCLKIQDKHSVFICSSLQLFKNLTLYIIKK